MSEHLPSKDQLKFSWTWDVDACTWRISTIDMGDGMLAGYEHLAGYYERRLIEEIERLRTALRGIQSCSTCEACRGAATRALGGSSPEPRDVSAEFTRLRERESKVSGIYERAIVLRMDLEDLLQRATQPPGDG